MTNNKGFGKKTQQAELIDGWLLPECQHNFFKGKEEKINFADLKTSLCLILGTIALRKNKKRAKKQYLADKDAFTKHQIDMCVPIAEIDGEFVHGCVDKIALLTKSDRKYIDYVRKLYELAEKMVKTGEEIPGFVRMTEDCRRWQEEAGLMFFPEINLIDNWAHPLSEKLDDVPGRDDFVNTWLAASLICGVATGRLKDDEDEDDTDPNVAISNLIRWGIIDIETASSYLDIAFHLDGEYLSLLSKTKHYFDEQAEIACADK